MNEIEASTYKKMSPKEREQSRHTPFTDPWVGGMLADIGAMIYLLPKPTCKVLDVGVASGWSSWMYAMAGYDVIGIDLSYDWIRVAKRQWKLPNLSYWVADYVTDTISRDIGAITMHDTLHHAEDEQQWLQRAYDLLPEGGVLLTCEPGTGHSTSQNTIDSVKKYGTIEKDMPITYIAKMGYEIGFSDVTCYPSAKQAMYLMYLGMVRVDNVYNMDTGIVRLVK